jgi:hypothetical protein
MILGLSFLLIAITSATLAQDAVSGSSGPNGFNGTAHFSSTHKYAPLPVVTKAPYSAEQITERVQTLADGSHITQQSLPTKLSRDSYGRVRTEYRLFGAINSPKHNPDAPFIIEITDPVANVKYTFDSIDKIAHRQQLPLTPQAANSQAVSPGTTPQPPPDPSRPQWKRDPLPDQIIEGLTAQGTRTTMTQPAGWRGNDQPLSTISENWWSPELQIEVLSKNTDPRFGERTQKLINISRAEPSPELFEPPSGFTIVEEAGDFAIKWGTDQ